MSWDSSRTVPWMRLMREWVIYAAVMGVVFLVIFKDDGIVGPLSGLLVSGPLYLLLGGVLAKFGYQRKTLKELRAVRNARGDARGAARTSAAERADLEAATASRGRPAPTRRTSTGPSQRPKGGRKRR